jgi:hypothetical protein
MITGEYYQIAKFLGQLRPKDDGATVGEKRLWMAIVRKFARDLRSFCEDGDQNRFFAYADPSAPLSSEEEAPPATPTPAFPDLRTVVAQWSSGITNVRTQWTAGSQQPSEPPPQQQSRISARALHNTIPDIDDESPF